MRRCGRGATETCLTRLKDVEARKLRGCGAAKPSAIQSTRCSRIAVASLLDLDHFSSFRQAAEPTLPCSLLAPECWDRSMPDTRRFSI